MKKSLSMFACAGLCFCILLSAVPGLTVRAESTEVTVLLDAGEFGKLSSKRIHGPAGTKIGILPVPINQTLHDGAFNHQYFAGWYLDEGTLIDENYVFTEDVTLHALWRSGQCRQFTDVPETAWYREAVDYSTENGLVAGTADTTFSPTVTCSRAMVAAILYRMAGNPKVDMANNAFTDVPENAWYAPAVVWAAERGIVSGVGDRKFAPSDDITREQLSCMIRLYAEDCALCDPHSYKDLSAFSDSMKVSAWAEESVQWAVGSGLISGRQNGQSAFLNPLATASRAEVVQVLFSYARLTDSAMTFFTLPYAVTVPSRWQGNVTAQRCENGIVFFSTKIQSETGDGRLFSIAFSPEKTEGEVFGQMRGDKDDRPICDVVFTVPQDTQTADLSPALDTLFNALLAMRHELAVYSHHAYFVSGS